MADGLDNPILRGSLPRRSLALLERWERLYASPEKERERLNAAFVEAELQRFTTYFDQVERNPLTDMQRRACVVDEDNNLVLAGAGSGKTSVIIGRAGYLIESGRASPDEILILAFGRKAAQETDQRTGERLGGVPIESSTFHALGRSIVGKATGEMPGVSDLTDAKEREKFIHAAVLELAHKAAFNQAFQEFLTTCPVPYTDPFSCKAEGEFYRSMDQTDVRTLMGEKVKSFEEACIANFLALNGVRYQYEAKYPHQARSDTAPTSPTSTYPTTVSTSSILRSTGRSGLRPSSIGNATWRGSRGSAKHTSVIARPSSRRKATRSARAC